MSRAKRAADKLTAVLERRFQAKRRQATAHVTSVTRDDAGRAMAAYATIDGVPNMPLRIGYGERVMVGDSWVATNAGSEASPAWEAYRRVEPAIWQPPDDPTISLPTPPGLQVYTWSGPLPPGGSPVAWAYAWWHTIGKSYLAMRYEVECCGNDGESSFWFVTDPWVYATSARAITASDAVIPRLPVTLTDFPLCGWLKFGSELIDYDGYTYLAGDSGTGGVGSSNSFYVAGAGWTAGEWVDYALCDSAGTLFRITANTTDTLTVAGTPASGDWWIDPCFYGCTRGVGGTTAAAHSAGGGMFNWSIGTGLSVAGLIPGADYNVRVRAHSLAGATSAWTAWVGFEAVGDTTAPSAPTGLATESYPGAVRLTWTGPLPDVVGDLAGFQVWRSEASSGTGATKVATTGPALAAVIPSYPGVVYYWNLKAFDYTGNVSGYGASWVAGAAHIGQGMQLLTNADFERDLGGNGVPDGWTLTTISGNAYASYGAYGREGSTGWRQQPTDETSYIIKWPMPYDAWLVTAEVGQVYTTSIYFQTTVSPTLFNHLWSTAPDGDLSVRCCPSFHNGVDYTLAAADPDRSTRLYDLGNDWYRLAEDHVVTSGDITDGKIYIGFWLNVWNRTGSQITIAFDRPQLEMGYPSEWKPGLVPPGGSSASGLLIDGAGIVTSDGTFALGPSGRLHSDFLPSTTSDARDLGSTSYRWNNLVAVGAQLSGDLAAVNADLSGDLTADGAQISGNYEGPGSYSLDDDTAMSITPGNAYGAILLIYRGGTGGSYGMVAYRATASPTYAIMFGSSSLAATSGVLTGTTGTDGKFTVSPATDGKVYLENRMGGTTLFHVVLMGA